MLGTNPINSDSDGDGHSDLAEVNAGKDPLSADSKPGGGILGTLLLVIFVLLCLGAVLAYAYYKKVKLPFPSRPSRAAPQQMPPQQPLPMEKVLKPIEPDRTPRVKSHAVFEKRAQKRRLQLEKVFDAFNVKEKVFDKDLIEKRQKQPVPKPKPTEKVFDKLADIPKKSGEEVFKELRNGIEKEEGK